MPVKLNKNAIERPQVIEIHFSVAQSAGCACCDISIRLLWTTDDQLKNTLTVEAVSAAGVARFGREVGPRGGPVFELRRGYIVRRPLSAKFFEKAWPRRWRRAGEVGERLNLLSKRVRERLVNELDLEVESKRNIGPGRFRRSRAQRVSRSDPSRRWLWRHRFLPFPRTCITLIEWNFEAALRLIACEEVTAENNCKLPQVINEKTLIPQLQFLILFTVPISVRWR